MMRAALRKALSRGHDPDPRFTLANERTFLAWIRTGLAFVAAGVAVDALAPDSLPTLLRTAFAVVFLGVGGAIAADAFRRWLRTEQALRDNDSISPPLAVPLLAGFVGLLTGVLVTVLLVS